MLRIAASVDDYWMSIDLFFIAVMGGRRGILVGELLYFEES